MAKIAVTIEWDWPQGEGWLNVYNENAAHDLWSEWERGDD